VARDEWISETSGPSWLGRLVSPGSSRPGAVPFLALAAAVIAFVCSLAFDWIGVIAKYTAQSDRNVMSVYGAVGLGAGFVALRWLKTADNATDYSIQNTANALIWLPTTREEKYRAKQAVDTLFVRLGDVVAAGFVAGSVLLHLSPRMVGFVNVALAAGWLAVAFWVSSQNERLSRERGVGHEDVMEKAA